MWRRAAASLNSAGDATAINSTYAYAYLSTPASTRASCAIRRSEGARRTEGKVVDVALHPERDIASINRVGEASPTSVHRLLVSAPF
jgi:hypothetical protein